MTTNWTTRYLRLAKEISTWSKDPSTKVGAVVVGEAGQILTQGYNGFPRGIADDELRLNDREIKYEHMVHGEMNCIYNASYNGVSLKDSTIYVWGLPVCHICCNGLLQVGIRKVVMGHPVSFNSKWAESWSKSRSKLIEAKIAFGRYEFEIDDAELSFGILIENANRVNGCGPYVYRDQDGNRAYLG